MYRLTVLMPVFNAEHYVAEAVRSLLNQTFRDFELWLIDDGSTDGSRKILESFSDPRIKKFFYDHNRGRVEVVNGLVRTADTEFITVTDADDISHPQRFELQLDYLYAHKEVMMCGTSFTAIDREGFVIRSLDLSGDYNEIYRAILNRSQFLGASTIMRKEIVSYFNEFYRTYFKDNVADSDLNARIVDRFPAVNLPYRLYYYRILKTSLSRKNYTVRFASLDKIIGFLSMERRESGEDSLMKNDFDKLNTFIESLTREFQSDPSLLPRRAAFYHGYWKVYDLAWTNAMEAFRARPLILKNIFLVFYIALLSVLFRLKKKVHYTTILQPVR